MSFLVVGFYSCSNDEIVVNNELDSSPVVDEIIDGNTVKTKASSTTTKPFLESIGLMHRYYRHDNSTNADHYYGKERPQNYSNVDYIPNGIQKQFYGKNYSYEGNSFYFFNTVDTYFNGTRPDLPLYSVYISQIDNTILFTMKPGESDPYPGRAKTLIGYVFSEQIEGTVAIREYYSPTYKDSFYISDDDICNRNGDTMSSSYKFQKIIGYTLQSYRISRNYYDYIQVRMTRGLPYGGTDNYYKIGFTADVTDIYGNLTGQKVNLSHNVYISNGDVYTIIIPSTYDITSSNIELYYKDGSTTKVYIPSGEEEWYFRYPFDTRIFSYSYRAPINLYTTFMRVGINLWDVTIEPFV